MSEEKQIKDIIEILELSKEEVENNNDNITATLDLQDLKSLKNLYDLYNKEKALNEELQIRYKIENDKYKQEKEKNKELEEDKKYKDRIIKGLGLNTIPRTINSFNEMIDKYYINKDKIRDLIVERQFELQQEFKNFKDDIRLNTLQEIYYLE